MITRPRRKFFLTHTGVIAERFSNSFWFCFSEFKGNFLYIIAEMSCIFHGFHEDYFKQRGVIRFLSVRARAVRSPCIYNLSLANQNKSSLRSLSKKKNVFFY